MIVRSLIMSALLSSAVAAQTPPDSRRQYERDLFEKIIETPTVNGRTAEFRKLTALLKAEFAKAGMTNVVVKDHDGTQTLIARWPAARPSGKKPIVLMAHMDVVEAKASDWQNPPFEFREKDGYYLGRGASDNKAALTGVVLALQNLKRSGFQPTRDIIVLFTGDEETHMNSVRRASTEWRSLIDSEYALNFDAGGGSVYPDGRVEGFGMQIAEKTYADYKLVATNRGGHSSNPRPDNAIYALAGGLKAIEAHRF
ncbi:MAG TPA: M20/M25/M40 family metallo-hydrolase, partial [Reyranella sp.]|nr:M20/M25/M40 family metallo-hydrolase [Reyranella sp.]